MRSITFKLTLAFLLIGVTSTVLVAVIIRQRTNAAFGQFLQNRDQQDLSTTLTQYYEAHGSWDELVQNPNVIFSPIPRPTDQPGVVRRNEPRFVLIGPDRTVLVSYFPDQIGKMATNQEIAKAIPLTVNGSTIGWLERPQTPPPQFLPNTPESGFLLTVDSSALLTTIAAGVLACILGWTIAFTMTRSLRDLTDATAEIASGRLGGQVKVRTSDELGQLAASFNKMSADLAQAMHARKQMTADIAHDLRSPLTVLIGYAEALSDGKLPGTPEVYNVLYQETQHLSHLVDDLRILSLADAGELPLDPQTTPPGAILQRVVSRHSITAQQKGLTLRAEEAPGLPMISVDVERMVQVLDNLVTNAFRYTPAGGEVVLTASRPDTSPIKVSAVQLQVRNTGKGIDPVDLPHIFDRFYRGDKARQSGEESGLGLAIARSIVEAHGGTITAASTPGKEAVFTLTLPARTVSSEQPSPEQ